jgi:hypothetical protein
VTGYAVRKRSSAWALCLAPLRIPLALLCRPRVLPWSTYNRGIRRRLDNLSELRPNRVLTLPPDLLHPAVTMTADRR